MRTPIFQIDAFTTRPFAGNPAAVMLMDRFPEDTRLQEIAAEKAGIIKPRVPVVISQTQPETVEIFAEKAEAVSAFQLFSVSAFFHPIFHLPSPARSVNAVLERGDDRAVWSGGIPAAAGQ